jgi:argininosuccinate lyase
MAKTNQAWGGRFKERTTEKVERMNASVSFDHRLAIEDISGSIAHSRMLASQKLLDPQDQARIEAGLVEIAGEVLEGSFEFAIEREDVHMNIEGALADRLGEVAGRLHTGRSRNDQVALDLRLWLRRNITELAKSLLLTVETICSQAEQYSDTPMPGYTHLQRAQPITFGHHLMAYGAMFLRDVDRLLDARKRSDVLPLGSGALAGSPLPLDRNHVAATLEMSAISLNSLDAVSDRDPAIESVATLSILMMHISRLAEEICLWTSQEFAFVELSDSFCTGSSLMPQKKNPDIPELLRGKAGRVFGDLQSILTLMKGLPLAYNKDMQEDKEAVFDAFDTASDCVAILPELLQAMTPRKDRMAAALKDGFVLATDLADYLVTRDVPFREAHHVIGSAVALCLERGIRLEDLTLKELQELHQAFDEEALLCLDPHRSLSRRDLPGAPHPQRVLNAVAEARQQSKAFGERASVGGPSAVEIALALGKIPT